MFDTLVKLASLGASGVCVLAIFWVGHLIANVPRTASREQHKTLRLYMGMTIVIAVIAFASGLANAWFNSNAIQKVEQQKEALSNDLEQLKDTSQKTLANYQAAQARSKAIVESLAAVLDEKVLAARAEHASDELKSHIRILKGSIERLNAGTLQDGSPTPQ